MALKTAKSKKTIAKKAAAPASEPSKRIAVDAMKVFSAEDKMAKAALTHDGFDNFISRLGLNNDNALSGGTYQFNLVTRNRIKLEAAYRGSWVVGAVVDSVAEDMTRAGIDITTSKDDSDLKEIHNTISRLQIWQSMASNIKWGRLYGGSLAVIQIEGQDLKTPLNLNTIAKDQFRGLVVYDRWQLNPILTDVIDSGPEMGLPKFYQIVNNPAQPITLGMPMVHHSRVIRFTGIDLPYFQAITEMMWGESVLERLWDRLISFDNATMSSASLIDRANLRTVGIENLREIIALGGKAQEGLEKQFEMMRLMQVNEGITLLDKNDEFQSTAYSFAGLSDMMLQFAQQLSGATGIPLVRLFAQSPSGMNATGESDLRMYYDNINAWQEAKLRTGWEALLKVLWRSTYGKPSPDDLEFTFTPLWQMDATDQANNAKTNTETILGAQEAGVTDRATSLKELKQISGDTGLFSSISEEDIAEAELDPPPMPETEENPEDPNAEPDQKEDAGPPVPNVNVKSLDSKSSRLGKIKKWLSK